MTEKIEKAATRNAYGRTLVELGKIYKDAHNDAVDAVAAYEEAGGYGETSDSRRKCYDKCSSD